MRLLPAILVALLSTGCGAGAVSLASPTTSSEVSSAQAPPVPALSEAARAAGFLDIRTVVPGAIVDLRYATSDNFVGAPLYPPDARCLVHESLGPGLAAAARTLRASEEVLVFWDCYRPHEVQARMFEAVPDPNWVARPGPYARSHETGRSVDVTLASAGTPCPPRQRVGGLCLVDMGTDFDEFSARAHAFAADGVSADVQANRARLRAALGAGGLTVYPGEWWHFDGPGAHVERPILDVPVN